jgi:Protein of unknown function (DUF2950)
MPNSLSVAMKHRVLAVSFAAACLSTTSASATTSGPEVFASPELAVDALATASRTNDPVELRKIFGSAGEDLISSGDAIADKGYRAEFVERFREGSKIVFKTPTQATLVIGEADWSYPIPIVKHDGGWTFDAEAGAWDILSRRVGSNELNAIEVCRSYVQAQREYAADLVREHKTPEFAQKFVSATGEHDGLYWTVRSGEPESPIGPTMATAQAEGYGADNGHAIGPRAPYQGYFYKILKGQGPAAPGGRREYIVGGHMTGGFALIAIPAKYGDSGVMTFFVSQYGIVYEKDLGPTTEKVAPTISEFNPDSSWSPSLPTE